MKFGSLALLACMVGNVASVQQTSDVYYHERMVLDEENGGAMWTFGGDGVNMYSPEGEVLKALPKEKLPMCTSGDEGTCSFFDYISDGHKYVYAAAFGPNRIDVFDIETGDYVTYVPTCSTPIDLDYHPNTGEMWIHCAGTDEANGHDGHIDAFSVNSLGSDFKQINLNVTGRAYGRNVVHSTLGNFGYASVYKQPYLYKLNLATKEIEKQIDMPLTWGGYDMTYSPMNRHVFIRTRVTCTCGGPDADKESCGRGGPSLVDVLTGPNAGAMQVNGTTSGSCEGSKADTLGVYEFNTKTDELVASHNIKEGTGFGADPAASPDGKYIVLMGNDGGQNLRVLMAGENGAASTVIADIPVEFEGGSPGQISISDFAFVTNNDKTVLVVASGGDNNIALIDMDTVPLTMRKLSLTTASESTGGRSRAVEWSIGTDYVWINGAETNEVYIVEIPGGDITAARVMKTLQEVSAGQMLYVKNWKLDEDRQFLKGVIDGYFEGDSPLASSDVNNLVRKLL